MAGGINCRNRREINMTTTIHPHIKQKHFYILSWLLIALFSIISGAGQAKAAKALSDEEALSIAADAYIYAYPLVIEEVTRQIGTNVKEPDPVKMFAPMNQFSHAKAFPDATFTDVVRANVDTLYSSLFFDVTKEPLVIHVPDSQGRYYLLPMLDMWTDVFAAPGSRTTGTGEQTFAIVGPNWSGKLPNDVELIRSPTGFGWMIGRVQTDGKSDYENVHEFQAGLTATPLSAYGKNYTLPKGKVDPSVSPAPPVEKVFKMASQQFFTLFSKLTIDNPPHPNDYPILARMKRIGLEPGKPFDLSKATPQIQEAIKKAIPMAQEKIKGGMVSSSTVVNNWGMLRYPVGTYGTDYLRRARIAFGGLGANLIEDAVYPTAFMDADGEAFSSDRKYRLHFQKDQIPPVRAFWSLTMYNDKQFLADNPVNRYAIGDRDNLKFNNDGSLTVYIQRESPGKDKESNWLPTPNSGEFTMNLRLYWPKQDVLDGNWKPPAVQHVK